MKKIILTGGGTAGHVTPLLALLPELKRRFGEIHFFGRSEGIERELTEGTDVIYHAVDCPRLTRGKLLANFTVPFKLAGAVRKAKKLIAEIEPNVIFSKGGYVALPAAIASGDVPLVLHESDTSLGLANKLSAKKADAVCSSFPLPPFKGKEITQTGSPLRRSIYTGDREAALRECGFGGRKKILLVMGGSLGAAAINKAVDANLGRLLQRYDVVHIRGRNDPAEKRSGYYPVGFTHEMPKWLAAADFALTRGGGNSLFELGALRIPMLVVPLPKGASRGDQVKNAEFFAKRGLALTLDQSELSERLIPALAELEKSAPKLIAACSAFTFDGTKEIVNVICGLTE